MSLIDIVKVLKQAVTEIWVIGRVAGKPKVVITNKGSRQGKLGSQNLDEACLKRRYSVYLFETTMQGSVLKVL